MNHPKQGTIREFLLWGTGSSFWFANHPSQTRMAQAFVQKAGRVLVRLLVRFWFTPNNLWL
jgi:hypothetical protein